MFWLSLLACDPAPTEAPATPAPAPAHSHDATPHSHAISHGGEVRMVGDLHVEARFLASGVMVWISDAEGVPVALDGVTGEAAIRGPDGERRVALQSTGDHLHAPVALSAGAPAEAVLTIAGLARPVAIEFRTTAVGR